MSERKLDASEVRRWLASRQAGEEREREEARNNPMSPERAFSSALALAALAEHLHGWPIPEDAVTRRENALVRRTWRRLRRRLGKP